MNRIWQAFFLCAFLVVGLSLSERSALQAYATAFDDLADHDAAEADLNVKLAQMQIDHVNDVMDIALLRADRAVEQAGEVCSGTK